MKELSIIEIADDKEGKNIYTFDVANLHFPLDVPDGSVITFPTIEDAKFISMEGDWRRDPFNPEEEVPYKESYGIKVLVNCEQTIVPVWQLYTEYPETEIHTIYLYWHAKRIKELLGKTLIMERKYLHNKPKGEEAPYFVYLLREMSEKELVAWMYKELEIKKNKEIVEAMNKAKMAVEAKYRSIIQSDTEVTTTLIEEKEHEEVKHRFTWGEGYVEYEIRTTVKTYLEKTFFRGHLVNERTYTTKEYL